MNSALSVASAVIKSTDGIIGDGSKFITHRVALAVAIDVVKFCGNASMTFLFVSLNSFESFKFCKCSGSGSNMIDGLKSSSATSSSTLESFPTCITSSSSASPSPLVSLSSTVDGDRFMITVSSFIASSLSNVFCVVNGTFNAVKIFLMSIKRRSYDVLRRVERTQ